jgi:ribosomal protein S6--L-glutamate ligase
LKCSVLPNGLAGFYSGTPMPEKRIVIALEARLRNCKNINVLGVFPNFSDYPETAKQLILAAKTIYYPTGFYAELFDAMGKKTFPSYHTYKFSQDKIKQTAIFNMAGIPHPVTRVFYGQRQKNKILDYFSYPFIAKIPRGSALGKGVYLIKNASELEAYMGLTSISYIQEYLKNDRDVRVVIVGDKIAHAYWRIAAPGNFKSNIAEGGTVCLDTIPEEALNLALKTAKVCNWDDVGLDLVYHNDQWYVIEGNMKYGREGFRAAGIDFYRMMERKIENGEI